MAGFSGLWGMYILGLVKIIYNSFLRRIIVEHVNIYLVNLWDKL
jgi:hypothetical protein